MRNPFVDGIIVKARSLEGSKITRCGITVTVGKNVYPTGELSEMTVECLDRPDIGLKGGEHVLDYGTGTGFLAIAAAMRGASQVLAVDINEDAVRCAQENAACNRVSDRVQVVISNGFDAIDPNMRFDLILAGMPFEKGETRNVLELAVYDPNYKMRSDLFSHAISHLNPGGRIFTSYSERVQSKAPIEMFDDRYFVERVGQRVIHGDLNYVYMLQPRLY